MENQSSLPVSPRLHFLKRCMTIGGVAPFNSMASAWRTLHGMGGVARNSWPLHGICMANTWPVHSLRMAFA